MPPQLAALLLGCDPLAPNVVLFVVDTLRADALGPYGNTWIDTPHLDAFAADAMLFESAFSSSSWTRPAMASLLTGLHPGHHGVMKVGDGLPAQVKTLAEHFAAGGYATAFVTANPSASRAFGFDQGFEETIQLFDSSGHRVSTAEMLADSDAVTRAALAWVRAARRPFFLTLLSIDPHAPYSPPARLDRYGGTYTGPIDGRLETLRRGDFDEADRARIRALYAGEVAFADESFGKILRGLEALAALESSVIVFTSDHGEEFWEYGRLGHGHSLVDLLLRVPLLIRTPSGSEAGRRIARSVALIDVAPTLLSLAGLPTAPELDGQSLFDEAPRAVPLLASLAYGRQRLRAAREHPFKLVRYRGLPSLDEVKDNP